MNKSSTVRGRNQQPLLLVFFIYTTQKHDLNIPTDTRRRHSDGLRFELELELDAQKQQEHV